MDIKDIIGKKAYWGDHTFVATKDKQDGSIRIDVYKSFPSFLKKRIASYFVTTKKHLVEMSVDETCCLRFYAGSLAGERMIDAEKERVNRNGRVVKEEVTLRVPTIDVFLECFRHELDPEEK